MKIIKFKTSVLIVLLIAAAPSLVYGDYDIIPKPQKVTSGAGSFLLDRSTTVVSPADKRSREIASFLIDSIKSQTGVSISNKRTQQGRIIFRFDRTLSGDESYRLSVTANGVVIDASNTKGFFWAVQTLRQLIPRGRAEAVSIPAVAIEDKPEFSYRGHMLDVGRHFFPIEFIKKQIDLLSYYKINTFRWHLTEDQGWRIEIKKYPKLTSVGAWRNESDGTTYGGFYTQDQIRDVVEYARVRNVMVIPEIEMPGHSMAALAAYPQFSCRRKSIEVTAEWGVHKDVFCPGNEQTFAFLQDVLNEVIALFPSPYIHIGGDEVPKDRWKECPRCQLRIKTEGLKDEHELQSYFIKRIQRYLASKGKTLIGWDEILEGGADKNAVVEVWRGDAQAAKALANENEIIIAGPFYFDTPLQSKTLKDVYQTDLSLIPNYAEKRNLIVGAEAPLWTEHITTVNAESKLYPRLQAFAEVTWTGKGGDVDDLRRRMATHYQYMDALGVAYGPEEKAIAAYTIAFESEKVEWRLTADGGFKDMDFRYTTDGQEPSLESPSFAGSLEISRPSVFKVAPFRRGRKYEHSTPFSLTANAALGKSVAYAHPIDKRYNRAGEMAMTDGILGSRDYNDGIWAGWQGVDLDATIDLGEQRKVNSIAVNFLQQTGSWIVLPRAVTFFASDDGANWTELQTIETGADAMDISSSIRTLRCAPQRAIMTRFVRLKAVQFGELPPGHNGAGGDSWIFADEIIVQ